MQISRFKGLNNTTELERLEVGELEIARNIELDDRGGMRRRTGLRKIANGLTHSLYSTGQYMFGVRSQTLSYFTPAGWVAIRNLASNEPVSYTTLGARTWFGNGVDQGVLDGAAYRDIGVPVPTAQPVAVAAAGSLPPGRYQYALTFEVDGVEGGTIGSGLIDLTTSSGIDFSQIATHTGPKHLYVSGPGDDTLYRVAELDGAQSTFHLEDDDWQGRVLRTQFLTPPLPGTIYRVWNGVLYVVIGDAVLYSKPYEFELFDLAHRFLQFDEPVTMFEPMHSGVYVGTSDRVYWMAGESPEAFNLNEVTSSGAIRGTAAYVSAADLLKGSDDRHGQNARPALMWRSTFGLFSGYDGGQVLNLTERSYRINEAIKGAAFVRNESGFSQYLASLQGVVQAINV